jgi:3-deoxy-manno-octulosonate cytidylyltransferase (CMP-KDO synthetase)
MIPARLGSTRFPAKIFHKIHGISLLEHTWRAALRVPEFEKVVIALDDQKTADLVTSFGGEYIHTSPSCPSGTHRIIEALALNPELTADIWVNWQADEPLVTPAMINDLLRGASLSDRTHIWTLQTPITQHHDITNPSIVKVVTGANNRALYFSRTAIPYYRIVPEDKKHFYIKHIGLYAYTTSALQQIAKLPPCPLATAESLEQLQFLSYGIPITANPTAHTAHSIDTIQDLAVVAPAL